MSRLYKGIISVCDKFVPQSLRPLWEHPAGPKTIFFWAPACKWGLVIGGLGDLNRPADQLSVPQLAALTATGLVWSRYSLAIVPKNYSLFIINCVVLTINVYQLARVFRYRQTLKK